MSSEVGHLGAQKKDQFEEPRGLGKVSFPASIGHCVGNMAQRVVPEPLHAYLLIGNQRWGPGICIINSPENSHTHGVLRTLFCQAAWDSCKHSQGN